MSFDIGSVGRTPAPVTTQTARSSGPASAHAAHEADNVTVDTIPASPPPEVQDAVRSKAISQGHARALLGLEGDEARVVACRRVVSENLSVRQTEALVATGEPTPARTRIRLIVARDRLVRWWRARCQPIVSAPASRPASASCLRNRRTSSSTAAGVADGDDLGRRERGSSAAPRSAS